MPRRAATPEPMRASLQVLPPDSPHSNCSEPGSSRQSRVTSQAGAAHWTSNAKEKAALPKRLKSVSLKFSTKAAGLPMGQSLAAAAGGASPLRRASSAEMAWPDFTEQRPPRQRSVASRAVSNTAPALPPGSAAPDSLLTGLRVDACQVGPAAPPRSAGAGRPPLPAEKSTAGKSFASTAPAVVERPPVPTRPLPDQHRASLAQSVSSPASTPHHREEEKDDDDDDDDVVDTGRVYAPVVAAPLNSIPRGGARGRGGAASLHHSAAIGSTPGGRGCGGRGRASGASGGYPHMRSQREGAATAAPGSPGGDKLAAVLAGFLPSDELPRRPLTSPSPSLSPPQSELGEQPSAPRVAWLEPATSEAAAGGATRDLLASLLPEIDASGDSHLAEMAAELRRDLLTRHLLGDSGDSEMAADVAAADLQRSPEDIRTGDASGSTSAPWVPRSADARTVLEETERCMAEASARHEARKHELSSFLDDLRGLMFEAPQPGADPSIGGARGDEAEECLVSIPADFEDLVDLNAQLSNQRRSSVLRHAQEAGDAAQTWGTPEDSRPASSAGAEQAEKQAAERAAERLRIPDFLKKRIADEAGDQDPRSRPSKESMDDGVHSASDKMALTEGNWEGELGDAMTQITRLDSLLLKREAAGAERVKAGQRELELTRERLKWEEEEVRREKIIVLQRLKERGLMKSGNHGHTAAASRKSSTASKALVPSRVGSASTSLAKSRQTGTASALSLQGVSATASSVVEQLGDVAPPAIMDWSGWTSSAVKAEASDATQVAPLASADSDNGSAKPASLELIPVSTLSGVAAAGAAATDTDTSTFQLTSATSLIADLERDRVSEKRSQHIGQDHLPQHSHPTAGVSALVTRTLAPVAESDGEMEADQVVDDPYAADQDTIESLIRIDEQLQKIVPEQEWDAKSISSLPSWRPGSEAIGGSVAGDSASQGGRSVWSRPGSIAPGDPTLREQFESREADKALVCIEDQLRDIQFSGASKSEVQAPNPSELKKLLLQAASQSAPLDATNKVLALTGQASIADGIAEAAKVIGNTENVKALVPVTEPSTAFPESNCLQEAQQILRRLEGDNNEWSEAFGEAQQSLLELEQDVQSLEALPALTEAAEPPAEPPSESEVAPYVQRLEDLSKAVADMLQRQQPGESLLSKLRDEGQPEADDTPGLGLEQEGDGFGDFDIGSSDIALRPMQQEPEQEVAQALEIDLPAGDGVWDDAELERVVRAVNGHFGDVPPVLAEEDNPAVGSTSDFADGLQEDEDVDWGDSEEEDEEDQQT